MHDPSEDLDLPDGCRFAVAGVCFLGILLIILAIAWSLTRL